MAVAVANVEAEKERAAQADRAAFAAIAQSNRQVAALDERTGALEAERLAHARTRTSLESVNSELERMRQYQAELTTKLEAERAKAGAAIEKAQDRASGAERRAALHIEAERSARGHAEERAAAVTKRADALQSELNERNTAHHAAMAARVNETAQLKTDLAHWRIGHEQLRVQLEAQAAELISARTQLHAAAAQAELADKVISAVRGRTPSRKSSKTA